MLVGSGLLAGAFAPYFAQRDDVCIYAAGVSNSGCVDALKFARERHRLAEALGRASQVARFVYFGSCSVADPEAREMPYVLHKLSMEQMVREHPGHLILRMPQVAGITPNPHTLLNFLHARIARSESFNLWRNAKRNIIDIADAAAIACELIEHDGKAPATYNIANPVNYPMGEIVRAMERVIGKAAVYQLEERGAEYAIDIRATQPAIERAGVKFSVDYLENVIGRYYFRN